MADEQKDICPFQVRNAAAARLSRGMDSEGLLPAERVDVCARLLALECVAAAKNGQEEEVLAIAKFLVESYFKPVLERYREMARDRGEGSS